MKLLLPLCLFLFAQNLQFAISTRNEEIPRILSNEVKKLKTSSNPTNKLISTIEAFRKIKNKSLSDEIFCQSCHLVIGQIIQHRKSGASKDSMIDYFKKLCNSFAGWGQIACTGYINIEIDTVLYIIDNKHLTAERVCAIEFQPRGCTDPHANQWEVTIAPPTGHAHHTHPRPQHKATPPSPWKLLHLTDFHYDPLYQPGNNADCGIPLCCQKENGPPDKEDAAAGYWGDYHVCDTPWHSITNFMEYVTTEHDGFDFVYYTGDIISHKSWATSKSDNSKAISDLFHLFKETFGKTPVYPVLGNHEPHPTDFYSPSNLTHSKLSTHWVFDLVATEWAKWLPNDTQETIRIGGYYTVLVKPGFRIIALNSNVCFISNLWLIYDDEDPYDQLKWLIKILTEAEKNGEIVHIVSHIPPGEIQCLQQWTSQFKRIVDRFAPIIAAQFNGHTHLDELRLFYNPNDTDQVTNAAFNAGSFTTFVGFNPNYRVYDVDQHNYTVLDYDHYTYNLTKANQRADISPQWYKLYSFKEAYGLEDTSYDSLGDLVERMSKDETLVKQYYRFQVRESAPQMAKGCNKRCLAQLFCSITAVEATDSIYCQNLPKQIQLNKL